jgi:hypothetical protein
LGKYRLFLHFICNEFTAFVEKPSFYAKPSTICAFTSTRQRIANVSACFNDVSSPDPRIGYLVRNIYKKGKVYIFLDQKQ